MEDIRHVQLETLLASRGFCTEEGLRHIKTLPYLSIVNCLEGSYTLSLAKGKPFHVPAGCAFIAPAGILQDITHHLPENGTMKMCWVFLDLRVNGIYTLDDLYTFPALLSTEQCAQFQPLILSLTQVQPTLLDSCRRSRIGYALAEKLLVLATPKESYDSVIMPAIRKIRKDYSQPLHVEDLAALCRLSPSLFLRRFREETGETPCTFLMHHRLATAQALLQSTEDSIHEIAEHCGFYDQFYFSRRFRSRYGLSPSQYRQSFRAQII